MAVEIINSSGFTSHRAMLWAMCCIVATMIASPASAQLYDTTTPLDVGTANGGTQGAIFFDANGDGDIDVACASFRAQNEVHLNDGSGDFTLGTNLFGDASARTWMVLASDIDGDTDIDLLSVDERSQSAWYLNDGTGAFTAGTINVGGSNDTVRSAAIGDVDGDTDVDVIWGMYGERDQVWLNNGAGAFALSSYFGETNGLTRDVKLADMDGDGDLDVVVAGYNRQNQILLNDGSGNFGNAIDFGSGSDRTWCVHLADMDGDAAIDIVVGNYGGQDELYLNINDGSGEVGQVPIEFGSSTSRTTGIVTGDFDADFDIDIAVCCYGEPDVVWLNSAMTFSTSAPIGTGGDNARAIAAADMDGDGDTDIYIGNYSGSNQDQLHYRGMRQGLTGSFEITVASNPMRVGAASDLTIRVLDPSNNVITGYTGPVDLLSFPGGAAITTVTFMAGDMGVLVLPGASWNLTAGTWEIRATDGSLTGSLMNVVFEDPPMLTSLSYERLRGSMRVTIDGTGFDVTPANNTVEFGGVAATVISASTTQLLVEVPSGVSAGNVEVEVGGAASNTLAYTMAPICASLDAGNFVSGSLECSEIVISDDGQWIAFISDNPYLVAGDTNNQPDVFLYEVATTNITRLTENGGVGADGPSDSLCINADGSVVGFRSLASNLGVDGGSNRYDSFVWDSALGGNGIELISQNDAGTAANRNSQFSMGISDDGNRVVFISNSSNLDAPDVNDANDVFLRDRTAGTTTRMSISNGNVQANEDCYNCGISGDGNHVVFRSFATNLVGGVTNGLGHIFVRHLATIGGNITANTTVCVSVNSAGTVATGQSTTPDINQDGTLVVFATYANLDPTDTSTRQDIYIRDIDAQTTERVTEDTAGGDPNSNQFWPRMSSDGNYVVFYAAASDLVAGDFNRSRDVFRVDRTVPAAPVTVRVSQSSGGTQGDEHSDKTDVSDSGNLVAFLSGATNLTASDTNQQQDAFLRDVGATSTTLVSPDQGTGLPATDGSNGAGWSDVSDDGRYAVFISNSTDLSGGTQIYQNVFRYDIDTDTLVQITSAFGGGEIDGDCFNARISDDGDVIAFDSEATNLVAGDTNGFGDVFVYTVSTMTMERVSVSTAGVEGNEDSFDPSLSGDGTLVTFTSEATTLVANDPAKRLDVYLRLRSTNTTLLVSQDSSAMSTGDHSYLSSISNNGQFVVFASYATSFVGGDTNGFRDIYRYEVATGTIVRVSLSSGGGQPNRHCSNPHISNDGRYVVFHSNASSLATGDNNGNFDIFLRDMTAGTLIAVSRANGGGAFDDRASLNPHITPDGAYVVFRSAARNLNPAFTGGGAQIYVYDRVNDETKLVSTNSDGDRNNGGAANLPRISDDGRWVVYQTFADNMTTGDGNLVEDVYLAPVGDW